MPDAVRATLGVVLVLAAAVWVGGLVTLVVVTRVARRTVGPAERVAFFRQLGRVYLIVGGLALALALASGAGLLLGRPWNGLLIATAAGAAALVATTVVGVIQARQMTRLRASAVQRPDDAVIAARVHRGAYVAGVLRALIGVLSLALLALGVVLAM